MKVAQKISNLRLKNNRKFKVFLFFLILTSIIWLLIALSKTYTTTALFKVEYKGLPIDKVLQNKPVSELELSINAPGFTLLRYKIKNHKITFNLNTLKRSNHRDFLLPNTQLSNLNKQVIGETKVLNVLIDTIFLDLGRNISKKVVVRPNIDVKFKLGYNFIEKLSVKPDSVLITGPEKQLDSIHEIATVPMKLTDVYESIKTKLKLQLPTKHKNLILATNTVNVVGSVDKFTEGVIKIPVQIINEPENIKINPFPKEIEIIYRVGLTHFNKINENSLSVVFDYNQYKNDTLVQYLNPIIQQKSEYIQSFKVNPTQIEFLIQK
jgi:hypothetical protein